MSDDTTRGPGAATPEPGELELRKALATMNDLEPPRDDLFVQRAIIRGRARTSRRRSTVLGAAAAFVVVGAVGGSWVAANQGGSPMTASAGSAPEVMKDASGSGSDNGAGTPPSVDGGVRTTDQGSGPAVSPARDTTQWFAGLSTPQTNAFAAIETTLTSRWPDVFSGA